MCCAFWLVSVFRSSELHIFLVVTYQTLFPRRNHCSLCCLVYIHIHKFLLFRLRETKCFREDWVHLLIGGNCLALVLILISNARSEFISDGNLQTTRTNKKKFNKPTILVLSPWFATFCSNLLGHQAQLGSFITTCQSISWNSVICHSSLLNVFSVSSLSYMSVFQSIRVDIYWCYGFFFFFVTHNNTCWLLYPEDQLCSLSHLVHFASVTRISRKDVSRSIAQKPKSFLSSIWITKPKPRTLTGTSLTTVNSQKKKKIWN